jgi:hypothetical protein
MNNGNAEIRAMGYKVWHGKGLIPATGELLPMF